MNRFIGAAIGLILLGAASAAAESTVISPSGSRPSSKGAASKLHGGDVIVEPLENE